MKLGTSSRYHILIYMIHILISNSNCNYKPIMHVTKSFFFFFLHVPKSWHGDYVEYGHVKWWGRFAPTIDIPTFSGGGYFRNCVS